MKKSMIALSFTLLCSGTVQAEIDISGFASVMGGKMLSGTGVPEFGLEPTFLANYPIVGVYQDEWTFKPDSKFGLQLSADLTEGLSATVQLVGRGADDFEAGFEWAYISYELNEHWTLQAGQKRLPLYYYSDFFDVSYAYLWVRPAADNYTWQIFNYTGVNAQFSYQLGDWSVSGNLYTGREDDSKNKLLSEFFGSQPIREIWKDIVGGVLSFNKDWLDVRMTLMTYENERYRNGVRVTWDGKDTRRGRFAGLSANIDYNNVVLLSEINRLTLAGGDFDTYLVSAGYRIGEWTPFVSFADFDSEGEKHHTLSAGVRFDFHSSAAFKFQFDDVTDNGVNGGQVAGDSKAITMGIDLVF